MVVVMVVVVVVVVVVIGVVVVVVVVVNLCTRRFLNSYQSVYSSCNSVTYSSDPQKTSL